MSKNSPKIAVVLAGCGFKDGSEIRESVLSLTALSQCGAEVSCFAPDIEIDEIDHLNFKPTGKKRSLLHEAARIARGEIKPLESASSKNFDALVLPGGFGVAVNLCSFATEGPQCKVVPSVEKFIDGFIAEKKPIGAICIAPALVAKVFQKHGGVKVTLGNDEGAAKAIEAMGAKHISAPVHESVVDADRKVVTTPAYMYGDAALKDIYRGIEKCIQQVVEMCS